MKASIVDLRYKSKQILAALERRETVRLQYRGKTKGYIRPAESEKSTLKVEEHPMFGSSTKASKSVEEQMDELRGSRY